MGSATIAVAGLVGFDTNQPLSVGVAATFAGIGKQFVYRYVARDQAHPYDLTAAEIEAIHAAGMAVGIVQHFGPAEGWVPSGALGVQYGMRAVEVCKALGIPAGVTVLCDLEGVAHGTPWQEVDAYCRQWHEAVLSGGFEPGLYVGDACGLNAAQLYDLPFERYVKAYNTNSDMTPLPRGWCMKQHEAVLDDRPPGVNIAIDTDTIDGDAEGGFPTLYAPDNWP